MSSYPNMSQCMCKNTLSALLSALGQVVEAMHEEGPMFMQELNRTEKRAYQELFNMCEAFLSAAEEIEDECGRESEYGNEDRGL